MNSRPNVNAERVYSLDDRLSATHGTGWSIERCKESVTGSVDLDAPVASKQSANDHVMPLDQLAPCAVSEHRRSLGRSDEIGEEDRGEHPIELRFLFANGS